MMAPPEKDQGKSSPVPTGGGAPAGRPVRPARRSMVRLIMGLVLGPLGICGAFLFVAIYFHAEVQGEFVADGGAHAGFRMNPLKCSSRGGEELAGQF